MRAALSTVTRARAMDEARDGGYRNANTANPWPDREKAKTKDTMKRN